MSLANRFPSIRHHNAIYFIRIDSAMGNSIPVECTSCMNFTFDSVMLCVVNALMSKTHREATISSS